MWPGVDDIPGGVPWPGAGRRRDGTGGIAGMLIEADHEDTATPITTDEPSNLPDRSAFFRFAALARVGGGLIRDDAVRGGAG